MAKARSMQLFCMVRRARWRNLYQSGRHTSFSPLLAIVLAASVLAGCTAFRLSYQNGPTLVSWWIGRYIDTDASQKPFLTEQINQFFIWHRHTELPQYAAALNSVAEQIGAGSSSAVTIGTVKAWETTARGFGMAIVEHELPAIAELALTLKPVQVSSLQEKFDSNDKKFINDFALDEDAGSQRRARYRRSKKQFEDWFGSLSSAQSAALERLSDQRPLDGQRVLLERQGKQRELVAVVQKIVEQHPAKEVAVSWLRPVMTGFVNSTPTPANAAFMNEWRDSALKMTADVISQMTPGQRVAAAKRIHQLADDNAALSQEKS